MPERELSVRRLLLVGLLSRLVVDSGVQLFFPFLPVLAQGLGISTVTLGRLLSLRSLTGLLAPAFGALADRHGYRRVMRLGLALAGAGYAVIALSPSWPWAAAGLVLSGMGTFAFVPTLSAYSSARLPYARRARGLGVLEYAWALSGIVGLSTFGVLIELAGWRAPLVVLAAGLGIAAGAFRFLPAAAGRAPASVPSPLGSRLRRLRAFFALGPRRRSAWANLVAGGLLMFAGSHLFIGYGAWLVSRYGVHPAELGGVALILGLADLSGSVTVSLVADRLGKRRSVLVGLSLLLLGMALLPGFDRGLGWAVAGLIAVRATFEFSVVGNLPLLSEQVPDQRGKLMALATALSLLGPALSGLSGPWAFTRWGIWGLSLPPALALTGALLLVWLWVREGETTAA